MLLAIDQLIAFVIQVTLGVLGVALSAAGLYVSLRGKWRRSDDGCSAAAERSGAGLVPTQPLDNGEAAGRLPAG